MRQLILFHIGTLTLTQGLLTSFFGWILSFVTFSCITIFVWIFITLLPASSTSHSFVHMLMMVCLLPHLSVSSLLFISIYHLHSFSHPVSPLKDLVLQQTYTLQIHLTPSKTHHLPPPLPLTFSILSGRLVEGEAKGDDGSGLQDDERDVL